MLRNKLGAARDRLQMPLLTTSPLLWAIGHQRQPRARLTLAVRQSSCDVAGICGATS